MLMLSKVLLSMSAASATLFAATVATRAASDTRAAFQGVWRTVEVVVGGPAPQRFTPGATLAIFHGTYYSRVEVHAEGLRPALSDPASATADELRAAWGSFFAEAGTFEVSGNVITMKALVAKSPAAMSSGATTTYSYQRSGDTLTLTQLRTAAGGSPVPVTVKLARAE